MNFTEFYLTEHTQALYHATYVKPLYEMIKSNSIKLTLSMGADSFVNKSKYYYLSAMRVKYGNYAGGDSERVGKVVILDLNGDAISRVAKIRNVDYWGKDFVGVKGYREEQEERIMMDKPELKPLNKYVNSIHVYVGGMDQYPVTMEHLFYINQNADVKIYFYGKGNETAFKMQRTEKAVTDLNKLYDESKFRNPRPYVLVFNKDGIDRVGSSTYSKEEAEEAIKEFPSARIVHKDDLEKLGIKKTSGMEYSLIDFMKVYKGEYTPNKNKIIYSTSYSDYIDSVMSYIHNLKSNHPEIFNDIVKEMKKVKMRNVREFIKYAIEKIRAMDK